MYPSRDDAPANAKSAHVAATAEIDLAKRISPAIVSVSVRSASVFVSGDKIAARCPSTYKSHRRSRRRARCGNSSNGDHLDSYSTSKFVQPRQIYCPSALECAASQRGQQANVCVCVFAHAFDLHIILSGPGSPIRRLPQQYVYTTYVNHPRAQLHISRA